MNVYVEIPNALVHSPSFNLSCSFNSSIASSCDTHHRLTCIAAVSFCRFPDLDWERGENRNYMYFQNNSESTIISPHHQVFPPHHTTPPTKKESESIGIGNQRWLRWR